MKAILYIGHGSRRTEGKQMFNQFVKSAMQKSEEAIQEVCFLELAEPTIAEGVKQCVDKGATTIVAVPVLLFSAGHAKVDIPRELAQAKECFPHIQIKYGAPFGYHPDILSLLIERLQAAGWQEKEDASVLLVGRGSSDHKALQEFHHIRKTLQSQTGLNKIEPAFMAVTSPKFDEGLKQLLRQSNNRTVYVLPYLLFTGVLVQEIEHLVKMEASIHSITLCEALGYDDRLVDVLKERTEEAVKHPVVLL